MAAYCSNFGHFAFFSPLQDLGTKYDAHLWIIVKRVVDFLLVLIELFSLGVTAEALQSNIGSKSAISLQRGPADQTFQVEGIAPPHQPFFFSQKISLNDLSYGIKIYTDFSFVLSQFTRLTDGRTEFSSLDRVCIPCGAMKTQEKTYPQREQ